MVVFGPSCCLYGVGGSGAKGDHGGPAGGGPRGAGGVGREATLRGNQGGGSFSGCSRRSRRRGAPTRLWRAAAAGKRSTLCR